MTRDDRGEGSLGGVVAFRNHACLTGEAHGFLDRQRRCEPDPAMQREWIRRGEELLATSPLAHNQILFRRFAIEWAIERRQWDEIRRFAAQLTAFCAEREPSPYVDLVVDRGLTLADLAERPGDSTVLARLRTLRDRARAHDLRFSFPLPEQSYY